MRLLVATLKILLALCITTFVGPVLATAAPLQTEAPECATGVDLLGFSDALNKRTFEGASVGGLSALAYEARRGVYYSLVDNGPTAPPRPGSTPCAYRRRAGRSVPRRFWT